MDLHSLRFTPRRARRRASSAARCAALCAALWGALACGDKPPAEPPAPADAPTQPAEGGAPAAAPSMDPEPPLSLRAGTFEARALPDVQLSAEGVLQAEGATYLQIAMPSDLSALPPGPIEACHLHVLGERHGFAVPAGFGLVDDRPFAFVRLVGNQPAPSPLTLRCVLPANPLERGSVQTMRVEIPAQIPRVESLAAQFYEASARWFAQRGGGAFSVWAAQRLDLLRDLRYLHIDQATTPSAPPALTTLSDAMALYSGLNSVQLALASDRARGATLGPDPQREATVREIKPVDLPVFPWQKLLSESTLKPQVEALARLAPADHAWIYTQNFTAMRHLTEQASALLGPLGRLTEGEPTDLHVLDRYTDQLGLLPAHISPERSAQLTGGVGLIVADPFVREGAAVALLFAGEGAGEVLQKILADSEQTLRGTHSDLRQRTEQIAGQPVRQLYSPDRHVWRYHGQAGQTQILTNSAALMARILRLHADPAASLAHSAEYQYLRALSPDQPSQAGFAFLSDAFILRSVSPRTKALQGRRMLARAQLQALNYAALLYGWLEGRPPSSAQDLLRLRLIEPAALKHAQGGAIHFDTQRGAHSDYLGDVRVAKPLDELPFEGFTESEAGAYERFREEYEEIWRDYVDPVALSIERIDAEHAQLDLRLMPVARSPGYRRLIRMVGQQQLWSTLPGQDLRLLVALAQDAPLRTFLNDILLASTGRLDVTSDWVGDWALVGLSDQPVLEQIFGSLSALADPHDDALAQQKLWLMRLPLYVAVQVRDVAVLERGLSTLRQLVLDQTGGLVEWQRAEPYQGQTTWLVHEKIDGPGFRVHYSIVNQVLTIALTRAALQAQIDAVLAGRLPSSAPPAQGGDSIFGQQAGLQLQVAPGSSGLMRGLDLLMAGPKLHHDRQSLLMAESLLRAQLFEAAPSEAEWRALSLRWLGAEPVASVAGAFQMDPEAGVRHSAVGSLASPQWPSAQTAGSLLSQPLGWARSLDFGISFEGADLHRNARVRLRWQREAP